MLQDSKALWASCLRYIRENVSPEDYETLFSHVSLYTYKVATKTLVLQVPSSYICENIENKYIDVMRVAIFNTFGKIRLDWYINLVEDSRLVVEGNDETMAPDRSIDAARRMLEVAPGTAQAHDLPPIDSQLNPAQTFRTFIEGGSNKLSRSVGLSIAEHPQGTQFNPMFIFGPSGCGKTHLVNAIGNHCRKIYPQKRVLYVSARIFQVQYSNAVMQKKINDFIAFYQTIDMLIVDDVQEWMSAKGTQDTFFHIFNHLFRNSRRIILVSDRAPVELEGMNRRLLTRFSCGLMAEMEKPNLQLCVDILKKKILRDGLRVPDDVVQYIAQKANGSVRDLEGVINSLMAYSVVYNCNIDMRLVERVIRRAVKTDDEPLTVDDILECVCRHYEVTPNSVKGRSRKREFLLPRQLTMFLAKKYTNIPASRIGRMIGNRDHSTVLHSIDIIEKKLKTDKQFAEEVEKVETALKIKKEG
ncbi:MAG: chromosomal replication initiator protein DnaA [Prevotellaceae bacterium]|nr:chromosomal replication initiator protein DnaA [Prevotellaceae bacterium]MDO4931315.1 chromosomal replication initiator protein DnaA [Prevotellaceae bacterium]